MYRVALIGCGRIGYLFEKDPLRMKPATHAGAYKACRNTRIVAACDSNSARVEYFCDKEKIEYSFTDYREMLKETKPDIVSIAAWTEFHSEMAVEAARTKSVKGIYCEKPIAINLKEADKMISACRKRKIPLLIGHERRFDANFIKVKRMIDNKVLGNLKTIIAQTLSRKPPKLPVSVYTGGSLFHDGTHLFDLALYYGGKAKWVIGAEKRDYGKSNVESTVIGMAELQNGVNLLLEGGGEREYFKFDLDLQFERGRILIGNSGISLFKSQKSKNYSGFRELLQVPWKEPKNWENSFVGAVKELIRAIKTGKPPASSGEEAKESLKVILSLYESASNGGKKIILNKGKQT